MSNDNDSGQSIARVVIGVIVIIAVVLTSIVVLVGLSLNRVQANEWGCLYGGGPFEDKGLKQTIPPGKSGGATLFDDLVTLPADDRIYAIDKDPTTADFGGSEVIVPAKGTNAENNGIVPVFVPVQARFTINEKACELYQNYLKKYKNEGLNFNGTDNPLAPGGWAKFLNLQMNQALITSIRSQLSGTSYVVLYTDFSRYPDIQKNVSTALTASLKSSLGGEFFCGPSYVYDGKPDGVLSDGCPPIEIIIKEIQPVDPIFLANLQKIVANQEEQTVIQSNKDKAVAQATADKEQALAVTEAEKEKSIAVTEAEKEKKLAQTAADQETALAQTEASKSINLADALADKEVAEAFTEVVALQTANDLERKKVESAFCERLSVVGVDCAAYYAAQNWTPNVIIGDGGSITPILDITPSPSTP